ncbi:hypothetical protein K8Z61_06365 [Nocardioides sp. TRM66260-LWL]|uniref:hypothetical protein n=1 Tax=Nocardioides sp. TRM66260-LWL TaxID=2874478 RepID=UPI001CC7FAB5|nr:hypothetical protein [Nocardioides sp. TRM66260-LWL]MBZ5734115.1 hypothetical protein [Nocardioides sp. TRM66260-LWL]
MRVPTVLLLALALAGPTAVRGTPMPDAAATSTRAAPRASTVAGCAVLPASSWWHARVDRLPVHRRSADWLASMSPSRRLHPDLGGPYGIPVTVVRGDHPKVTVRFDYAAESDRVRYPLGPDTRIEGGAASDGDRHAIVVDRDRCLLHETWATRRTARGWTAGSGAVWSLRSNRLRPDGWTSADAAGLPILPGLLRWSEVRDDTIDHAVRFTTDVTARRHLWPARHDAGSTDAWTAPPMGARFRLRADYDLSGLGAYARRVARAFQRYGLVLADNGSPWFFQGEVSPHWPDAMVEQLKTIPASAFEAVDTASLRRSPDSGAARPQG